MDLLKKFKERNKKKVVRNALRKIDEEIHYQIDVLNDVRDDFELSEQATLRLDELIGLKERLLLIREKELYKFIDINALLKALAGVGVTLLVVNFEKENIFSSKAFTMIQDFFRRA